MGHVVPTWYDAIFEATSGLTTTGGTIIDDVDDLSQTYILWRSLLHWLGGLGIVVLLVAFIKSLGAQSSYFFYAESSVQDAGGLIPRVRQIAQHLWYVYIGITLACIGSLYLAGVSLKLFPVPYGSGGLVANLCRRYGLQSCAFSGVGSHHLYDSSWR